MKNKTGVDGWMHAVHDARASEHAEPPSRGEEREKHPTNGGDETHRSAVAPDMDPTKPPSESGKNFVADGIGVRGEVIDTVMWADEINEPVRAQPAFRHVGNIKGDEIH